MKLRILFSADLSEWEEYQSNLTAAFAAENIAAELANSFDDPAMIDFIIWSPASKLQDFRPFSNLKAILSLWAGVEKVVANPTINVPVSRMVDPDLTASMVEWVTGHVLRHHLGMDQHILHQDGVWRHDQIPPLARNRKIGILGLGALGAACATALATIGFDVLGWSKHQKTIPGVTSFVGADGIHDVLAIAEILVLLVPSTPDTENLLNDALFAKMRRGMVVINPGRGSLIADAALLAALANGQVSHATLDVFRQEPLPPQHPFWSHPRVTVTPHIAADTRPESASRTIAANLRRYLDGNTMANLVDMTAGY